MFGVDVWRKIARANAWAHSYESLDPSRVSSIENSPQTQTIKDTLYLSVTLQQNTISCCVSLESTGTKPRSVRVEGFEPMDFRLFLIFTRVCRIAKPSSLYSKIEMAHWTNQLRQPYLRQRSPRVPKYRSIAGTPPVRPHRATPPCPCGNLRPPATHDD